MMKVFPDSAGVAALDTRLRQADTGPSADQGPEPGAILPPAALPPGETAQTVGDSSEDLLVLDIWNGRPPGQLRAAQSTPPAAAATAQHWADHIFSPLR